MRLQISYNAEMGTFAAVELDSWLLSGGLVVTASDRAARAVLSAYHRSRLSEGRHAWSSPQVLSWHTFARRAWEERAPGERMVLNPLQEQSVWEAIIQASGRHAALLERPRRQLAALAAQAHALVCSQAPRYLDARTRRAWDQDAGVWSEWLADFEAICAQHAAVSANRLPLELVTRLDASESRPPLLLAGFDRVTVAQQNAFDAWGQSRQVSPAGGPAEQVAFYRAPDARSELAACARWCSHILSHEPIRRILVVAQGVAQQRGEIERAFLRENERGAGLRFEFSLGIPLGNVPVARSAEMLLRWLVGSLEEQELDWLFASGHAVTSERETTDLQAAMRALRRRNRQRTEWQLRTFLTETAPGLKPWADRMIAAQNQLGAAAGRARSPLDWADLVPQLLRAMGWPGTRPQSSAEFQAARRWNQVLQATGSLGFDGRRIPWNTFFESVRVELAETLFAPESQDAPIVIAGAAESAGLEADALWFLGADQKAWPAGGEMHPLLPRDVQQQAGMPHASAALDWEIAETVTRRLLASAPLVRFSFAAQLDGTAARPSRLVMKIAGAPQAIPQELAPASDPPSIAIAFEDSSRVPLHPSRSRSGGAERDKDQIGPAPSIRGGAAIITTQSQCPFKAFATARLKAETWESSELSLTASERGNLVHAVLHAVWAGPPRGVRSLVELRTLTDLPGFVAEHARGAMADGIPARIHDKMLDRYLALEEQRLARLITAWLQFELTRADFRVELTESEKQVTVAGLPLKLRLDRLDRLNDGTFLVIDYKTGVVSDHDWDLPRSQDLQLPLYAGFGLEEQQVLGGLVFARVRPGEMCFAGSVADAASTLLPSIGSQSALAKYPFEADRLMDWREEIEKLARDFIAGRAGVDPRDPPKTCERCGLHTLCRIQERVSIGDDETDAENADA